MSEVYSANNEEFDTDIDSIIGELIDRMEDGEEFPIERTVWVGEKEELTIGSILFPQLILENAQDRACDENPYSDGWLENVSEEAMAEMGQFLESWADKHDLQPNFYGVTAPEETVIRILNEDGDYEWKEETK